MKLAINTLLASPLAAFLAAAGVPPSPAPHLVHHAYVWQRAWTDSVTNAVNTLATNFGELIVLRAEVTWSHGSPKVAGVQLDYETLRGSGRPIGLALRIGTFSGPFNAQDERCRGLTSLAQTLIKEARTNGLTPAELQLDFDCAESKLDGYRLWVEAIKRGTAPVPVSITALPSWLEQPAFARLIEAADGYVLQVHSFERPKSADASFQLCDPVAARRAIAKAADLGRRFRVALPTYGYLVAFDVSDKFLGLSAEGPARNWPRDARIREVRANPVELAALVREWSAKRPAELQGVIWYRLPVADDAMNWRWPTLAAVMSGQSPAPNVKAVARHREPRLVEIELTNQGSANTGVEAEVALRWNGARLIAADGVRGYSFEEAGRHGARLRPGVSLKGLAAGERRLIGWLRFDQETEVQAEIHEAAKP